MLVMQLKAQICPYTFLHGKCGFYSKLPHPRFLFCTFVIVFESRVDIF